MEFETILSNDVPKRQEVNCKKNRTQTDPCGTPYDKGTILDFTPLINTDCCRWDKYDLNQLRAASRRPMYYRSLDSKISWSVVSNAALKSNKSKITHCFSSTALRIQSWIQVRAVSVLWYFLWEDWRHSCRPLVVMWSNSRVATTFL